MKKTILQFIILLTGLFASAQNIELLHKANKCDLDFARKFSDEIVSGAKTKFVFLEQANSANGTICSFVYIKEGLSESERKSVEAFLYRYKTSGRFSFVNENCLTVDFKITPTKEFTFDVVKGKFADLFAFYQKNIEPTATAEKSTTTGIYSVRKDKEGYWYNFIPEKETWSLKNMSNRLNK